MFLITAYLYWYSQRSQCSKTDWSCSSQLFADCTLAPDAQIVRLSVSFPPTELVPRHSLRKHPITERSYINVVTNIGLLDRRHKGMPSINLFKSELCKKVEFWGSYLALPISKAKSAFKWGDINLIFPFLCRGSDIHKYFCVKLELLDQRLLSPVHEVKVTILHTPTLTPEPTVITYMEWYSPLLNSYITMLEVKRVSLGGGGALQL